MKTLLYITLFVLINLSSFGQNQNISQGPVFDGEPYITVNPENPQHMVVCWIGYKFMQLLTINTSVSFDGGSTWSTPVDVPHSVAGYQSADPCLDFDGNGNVFLAYVDYNPNIDSGSTYCRKSTDGGLTWGTDVPVIGMHSDPNKRALDRPWINIDRSGGVFDGNIYITTMNASTMAAVSPPYNPYITRSINGGTSFEPWQYLDTAGFLAGYFINNPMPTPTIGSNGTFYAIYPSYVLTQSNSAQLMLATSTNGGASYNHNVAFQVANGITDSLSKRAGLLRADPSDTNHLVMLSLFATHGDADVFINESFDKGATWSAATRVNDDPIGNNRMQDLVWGDFDSDGDLVVTWRDRRNGSDSTYQTASEIWGAIKLKGATSFASNFRISDTITAYDTILAKNGNDFMCVKFVNDTLNAVWGDVRSGTIDIWYNRIGLDGTILSAKKLNSKSLLSGAIYPNPTSSMLTVVGNNITQVDIYDQNGKIVFTKKYTGKKKSENINLDDSSKGIYIIEITTTGGTIIKKVVKH